MSKIGILGGTFNPIHIGHIKLAEAAYEALKLDKILIMPTGISYLKASQEILPGETRAEIVKLSIDKYSFLEYSDIEVKREGNTYTYETLLELKKIYPSDELYFIIGADTLYSMEKWKNPETIFENCNIAAMIRDNYSYEEMILKISELSDKYKASITLLNAPKFDISSSEIRKLFEEGDFYEAEKYLVPEAFDYILANNLYVVES